MRESWILKSLVATRSAHILTFPWNALGPTLLSLTPVSAPLYTFATLMLVTPPLWTTPQIVSFPLAGIRPPPLWTTHRWENSALTTVVCAVGALTFALPTSVPSLVPLSLPFVALTEESRSSLARNGPGPARPLNSLTLESGRSPLLRTIGKAVPLLLLLPLLNMVCYLVDPAIEFPIAKSDFVYLSAISAMLPMYPLEKVLNTCLVTSLQTVRLLALTPLGRPLAITKVRRLAISLLPIEWEPKVPFPTFVVHLEKWAHRLKPIRCLGTLLNMLRDTQWSLAWGQSTSPFLHSPRVTDNAPLVERPSPAPVLPRNAAKLQSKGGLRPILPCLMNPICIALVLPTSRSALTVARRVLHPLMDRVEKETPLPVDRNPSR